MNSDSRLIRWAYWLDRRLDEPVPRQTSLCVLFWRSALLTPMVLLMMGVTSPVWVPIYLLARFVVIPLLTALPDSTAARIEVGMGVAGDFILAAKQRVCPIIEIKRAP